MHCFAANRLLLVYVIFGSLWSLAAAETLTVTASQAKMYAHPDTKSREIASVPRGTIVSLLEHRAGWYQITLADGNTGWVAEALVAQVPEVAPARGFEAVSIRDRQGQQVALYRASYALVIGVSGYADWPRLPGVVQDITAVKAVLESQGFQVKQVHDPTLEDLRRAFDTFINTHGQEEEDRLLIYFAGHGHTLKPKYGGDMGYIVPVDAPNPQRDEIGFRARALSMEEIETYARRIQSKHALFLFDSCFSGAIFSLSRSVPEFINYKTSQPVRQFITSGQADETVPDVSIFRQQLVAALQGEADKDSDGYVTGSELGEFLQEQVTNYSHNSQHPQYGKLRDPFLDKGDFVFMVTRTAPPGPSSPSIANLEAQVEAQRQQVQEEQQRLDEERRLQAAHQKLQGEQEQLRQERAQLQGGGAIQGTQVAVGVSPQQPVAKTLRNSIGMELVLIQAGTFQMGSTDSGADDDEKPVHTVRISRPFYLGQYEVTQAQWEAVMGNNPSKFKGDPSHPVEQVSWDNVQEFIRRLNAKESGARYRLPTEAEWEYAARAGSTTVYSFGDSASQLGQSAWYEDNADGATHPVGRLQPNAWGLYDMHGNVWEWVQDWYGPYANGTVTDPTGPQSGSARVSRGGGWLNRARNCRSAERSDSLLHHRDSLLGLRLLREAS